MTNPTMTADDLLATGFRRYPERDPHNPHKIALYQKTIRDDNGARLYSLNVYEWAWPDGMPPGAREQYQWSISAQLYRADMAMALRLTHKPGMTPGEIEAFYREAHAALGCSGDPHND